jgi:hypothetical protein
MLPKLVLQKKEHLRTLQVRLDQIGEESGRVLRIERRGERMYPSEIKKLDGWKL